MPDYSNIPFSASPVVLSATPGRVSAPKDLFTPLLPLVPTAEREFATTDKVTAFLRLYQSGQKPIDRVQVTMRIRDASDRVVASETQSHRGRSIHSGRSTGRELDSGCHASTPRLERAHGIATRTSSRTCRYEQPTSGI